MFVWKIQKLEIWFLFVFVCLLFVFVFRVQNFTEIGLSLVSFADQDYRTRSLSKNIRCAFILSISRSQKTSSRQLPINRFLYNVFLRYGEKREALFTQTSLFLLAVQ